MTKHPVNILWVDFEATALMNNPDVAPLEGAAVITDGNLNELASFGPYAIHATEEELAVMNDFVTNMHTKTGLIDRVREATMTRSEFDIRLAAFAEPFFPVRGEIIDGVKYRGMVIGGNSVKYDFAVIEKFFHRTGANMDYRVVDVSSIGELARRWNRKAWEAMPPKASDHTAMTDIRASIDELRYYRDNGFGGL
ncbi:oligoribonuclease [Arthrobacter caoxuetaonis]|uniref:Oligoribonuclease n=1 Tax=Arthrobacter caoxuetaonis TaxID=2886935 RepID=A0A9X1MFX9_9MICC|nr:oligoribonuclease [Arthrobacter caoxuetaonis]MCC3299403.1 oligoribonuclease [Arthrobacter caoxuetaonis]USQ59104.1 oligoribonuclease [Arthrobacter caoxuetaonis]